MKITYKDVSMELIQYDKIDDYISFIFRNNGVEFVLFKTKDDRWYFGLNSHVSEIQRRTNELFLFSLRTDPFQEGEELYDFLFKKSPARVKLLLELGPDAYERNK